jgi:hypothetical protein
MEEPLASSEVLLHVAEHIFLPPKLPQQAVSDNHERQIHLKLLDLLIKSLDEYRKFTSDKTEQWARMSRMLSRVAQNVEVPLAKNQLGRDMTDLNIGGR